MVVYKDKVQDIKNVVNKLKVEQRLEFQFYCEVFCLWGSYDFIDNGECFQVKCIIVKFGEKFFV